MTMVDLGLSYDRLFFHKK